MSYTITIGHNLIRIFKSELRHSLYQRSQNILQVVRYIIDLASNSTSWLIYIKASLERDRTRKLIFINEFNQIYQNQLVDQEGFY